MKITGIIWLETIVDKLAYKHNVETDEVEDLLKNRPQFHFAEKGDREDEDMYFALGQTEAGRYLIVFFIHKITGEALVLSARDMTKAERRRYGRK